MFQTNDLQLVLFLLFSILSIASAIFITRQRNVFYASIGLAFLGIAIAVLIALLSPSAYAFYSAFHLLLYVGSAVVFLSISLVIFRGLEVKEAQIPWAGVAAVTVGALVYIGLFVTFSSISPASAESTVFSLVKFANIFLQQYWFPTVILIVALLTTMIEALSLARGEKT
ncbi:NADH-quinone oxidoreductase subunit J [Sulfolobus sp. SCGC AB-777_G06]|nr:NADH-quinone oxidoreductase subunit J [Sulfolobus sp. SCGC AB-777_G06]